MPERLVVVAALVVVAVAVALVAQRRRPAPPTNPGAYEAPAQLDLADLGAPVGDWHVVVFSSATCTTCETVVGAAEALRSDAVSVTVAEVGAAPELHRRYRIEAVPITVVADAEGVVRRSFVGPVSATHLWGAVAELRSPGSVPAGCGAGDAPADGHDEGHDDAEPTGG